MNKNISDMAAEAVPKRDLESRLVEVLSGYDGYIFLKTPIMQRDVQCPMCGASDDMHFWPMDMNNGDYRIWGFCHKENCRPYVKRSLLPKGQCPPKPKRALEWAKFCELNGIGDLHHDVTFDKIEQSTGKIDYLLKFAIKPVGIIFMQGGAGSGKTYACMGVCELFTRTNTSAKFTTQRQMLSDWLETFKGNVHNYYIKTVTECNLLVVDDFGTGEVSPAFMTFFMDLINTRMQWSDRGTIITTNLDDKKFSEFCGEALNDRIKTGQKFQFNNKTRRKQLVL